MSDRGRYIRRGAPASRIVPGGGPRFEFRQENGRWEIHDTRAGRAAELGGRPQIGLGLEEAEELTRILNRLDAQSAAAEAVRESGD